MFKVTFWGVRGSIPTPGPDTVVYGGNTSCLEVRAGDQLIILDGGTGLRLLGNALMKRPGPVVASFFFSHVHWDHIQGFPFFTPAFIPENRFAIYGGNSLAVTLGETLAGQMNYPNFPITLDDLAAQIEFKVFEDGRPVSLGPDVTIKGLPMAHPNGCYGYRVEYKGRAFAYCTDTEHGDALDANVRELARDADVFVYDTQYFPDEYTGAEGGMSKRGWGHSTYEVGAQIAREAGVKTLVLFHHDPTHDDQRISEKERLCQALFANTIAAKEGLVLDL
ncbi:MAG: MBL fold metallo-hydrolase [Myxococcales bacterium]|jgi:phosphoribosyl 1,2-cyclic phosphodiesterase|nr:MBL fold metallo-hydrolase [Myxococcales bacterium]